MVKLSGPVLAMRNEQAVLMALHRFSWLRTRDLAALIWQRKKKRKGAIDLSPVIVSSSSMRMAQKTLLRLTKARKINSMKAPDTSIVHGLSEVGARLLREQGVKNARNTQDALRRISLSFYHHRRLCNELSIMGMMQGLQVSTEAEISAGRWFGGMEGIHKKKPDGLIKDDTGFYTWYEVERSRRNATDYKRLMDFLNAAWPKNKPLYNTAPMTAQEEMLRVCFICEQHFIDRVLNDLKLAGWDENLTRHRIHYIALPHVSESKFIQRAP
ncbi:hypothetical protein MCEKH45_00772 [Methylophilaceae bacterium]